MVQLGIGIGINYSGGFISSSAEPSSLVIFDNFDRADNASLGTSTSGHVWQLMPNGSNYRVRLGKAEANAGGEQIAYQKCKADGIVSVKATSTGNQAGLAFRIVDPNNYWFIGIKLDGFSPLQKIVNGTKTTVGNLGDPTYVAGAEMKVVLLGSKIELWYDGIKRTTYTDPALQTADLHGLYSSYTGTTHDDFRFEG